jgi:hypothetical protein
MVALLMSVCLASQELIYARKYCVYLDHAVEVCNAFQKSKAYRWYTLTEHSSIVIFPLKYQESRWCSKRAGCHIFSLLVCQ